MHDEELIQRLYEVERKVNFLLRELGLEAKYQSYNPEVSGIAEVQELVNRGQIIQAIKLYREITGLGLAEAKKAVDQMRY